MKQKGFKYLIIGVMVALVLTVTTSILVSNVNLNKKLKGSTIDLETSGKEANNEVKAESVTGEVCDTDANPESYVTVSGTITQDFGDTGDATITFTKDNKSYTKQLNVKTDTKTNFKYVLPKGTYSLTVSKTNFKVYEKTISSNTDLNITLKNSTIGDVFETGQVGDNVYYKYYSDGTLQVTGSGAMWDGINMETDETNYNIYILNDIMDKTFKKNGITMSDEAHAFLFGMEDSFPIGIGLGADMIMDGENTIRDILTQLNSIIQTCDTDSPSEECTSGNDMLEGFRVFFNNDDDIKKLFDVYFSIPVNTRVSISDEITYLGSCAFAGTNIGDYVMSDNLTGIGYMPFMAGNVNKLTWTKSIKEITSPGFMDIYYVDIPYGVTKIGENAFYGNDSRGKLTSVVIPSSVTEIGNSAFYGNEITSVIIPNSVTIIGDSAFDTNQLTSIVIPNSVTEIGNSAFYGNEITSVIIPNSVTIIGDSAFDTNQLTSVIIPNSVTEIGNGAFYNNQLTEVSIPNSVINLSDRAFANNKLTSIVISKGITEIKSMTFQNNKLTNVTIPNSVTIIGVSAFDTNQLTSVTIPNSVTEIGSNAFSNNKITKAIIPTSVEQYGDSVFSGNNLVDLTIGLRNIQDGWSFQNGSLENLTLLEGVEQVGNSVFIGNNIKNLVIPSTLNVIEDGAFSDNPLESITINGDNKTRFNDQWNGIGFPSELMPTE